MALSVHRAETYRELLRVDLSQGGDIVRVLAPFVRFHCGVDRVQDLTDRLDGAGMVQ